MERHFTNSVYVYNTATKKFLFIKHKKLKKWLQPGGHWEANELPDDSAIREVYEETGLKVVLIGDRLPRKNDQVRPYGIQRNVITENEHEHIDLIYLATPQDNDKLIQNEEETDGIGWFCVNEITSDDFDTFDAQKQWVRYFYNLMNMSFVNNIEKGVIAEIEKKAIADGIQKKAVGAVIMFGKSNILFLRRVTNDFMGGLVELPSGGVDGKETLIGALQREVKEETGLDIAVIEKYIGHFDYLSKSGKKTRQFNFAVQTTNANILLNPLEHDEFYIIPNTGQGIQNLNISESVRGIIRASAYK